MELRRSRYEAVLGAQPPSRFSFDQRSSTDLRLLVGAFRSELLRLISAAEDGDLDVSLPARFLHVCAVGSAPKMKQLKTRRLQKDT